MSVAHSPLGLEQESQPEQAVVASNTGKETPEARHPSPEAVRSSLAMERHTPARPGAIRRRFSEPRSSYSLPNQTTEPRSLFRWKVQSADLQTDAGSHAVGSRPAEGANGSHT